MIYAAFTRSFVFALLKDVRRDRFSEENETSDAFTLLANMSELLEIDAAAGKKH